MDSFKKLVPQFAIAYRDGVKTKLLTEQLTLGDVIELKGGDRIPADVRILESKGFKVDNSSLTGESEPCTRLPVCTNDDSRETKNLAFFSTNAIEGTAKGVSFSSFKILRSYPPLHFS